MGIGRQCAAGTPAKGQTRRSAAPSCAPAGQPCAPAAAPAPAFDLDDDDDAVSSVRGAQLWHRCATAGSRFLSCLWALGMPCSAVNATLGPVCLLCDEQGPK